MKRLLRLHRYLSLLVAPAMLFFAISGAWQAYRFQETRKDGSYTAPAVLENLSRVHMAEKLRGPAAPWFRAAQLTVAALFVATALVGIVMALKIGRPRWLVWLCLAAGTAVPALLAILARAG